MVVADASTPMHLQVLKCAFAPGPLTSPLLEGAVAFERFEAEFADLPLRVVFDRAFKDAPFDVCELSFGRHIEAVGAGTAFYVGLPVFPLRRFRHDILYVRDDNAVAAPADLAGRRIGAPSWAQTALVACRGHLLAEHGLTAAAMKWVLGGVNAPAAVPLPRLRRSGIEIAAVRDASLSELLASGEIDAVMALEAPVPPASARVGFRRLIDQPAPSSRRPPPIMHLVGIRRDRLAADPSIGTEVLAAFDRARSQRIRLRQTVGKARLSAARNELAASGPFVAYCAVTRWPGRRSCQSVSRW